MVMSEEEIYWEEQEYKRAQEIMQKNVMEVTKEELDFLKRMNMIQLNIFITYDKTRKNIK